MYGSVPKLLEAHIPGYSPTSRSTFAQFKTQHILFQFIKNILPGSEAYDNYSSADFRYGLSNHYMEFDVFVPSLSLVFEYQGQQHYKTVSYIGSSSTSQMRDREKKRLCDSYGLTLITIPYWWNNKKESLIATIATFRPDIFPEITSKPIPSIATMNNR
jgi:hypothetical protein